MNVLFFLLWIVAGSVVSALGGLNVGLGFALGVFLGALYGSFAERARA